MWRHDWEGKVRREKLLSLKLKHKLNQMRMKKGSLHFNWIEVKIWFVGDWEWRERRAWEQNEKRMGVDFWYVWKEYERNEEEEEEVRGRRRSTKYEEEEIDFVKPFSLHKLWHKRNKKLIWEVLSNNRFWEN